MSADVIRICGHCGVRLGAAECTRCAWRKQITVDMLFGPPTGLPCCPSCFAKPMKYMTYTIEKEQPANQAPPTISHPLSHEGRCWFCFADAYQWQRDQLRRIITHALPHLLSDPEILTEPLA